MSDFISICFTGINSFFTAGLLATFAYWLLFLAGGVDGELFDGDAELPATWGDAANLADGIADLEAAAEGVSVAGGGGVAGELSAEGPANTPGSGSSDDGFSSVVSWILPHGLPLTILLTIWMTLAWSLTILGSAYGNNRETWSNWELLSWAWGLGSLLVSLPVSRLLAWPLGLVFRHVDAGQETQFVVLGKTCVISTSEVTSSFGQAQIMRDGGPVTLNVRTAPGVTLRRGDEAIITACDAEQRVYRVVPFQLDS